MKNDILRNNKEIEKLEHDNNKVRELTGKITKEFVNT